LNAKDPKKMQKLILNADKGYQNELIQLKASDLIPMFHIDFHGKLPKEFWTDPVKAVNLDFATLSMKKYFSAKD
jgi:hypothetical protein